MKLSEIKAVLAGADNVSFKLEDGTPVPEHFHVTEIGAVSKHFIDCGGTIRKENKANFQLWDANDFEHRLKPQKLLNIIKLSEQKLGLEDDEIEVEYQSGTIGKYGLSYNGSNFILTAMHTACLAKENCGKPAADSKPATGNACCAPAGGCC
jgi:hypothetical protein